MTHPVQLNKPSEDDDPEIKVSVNTEIAYKPKPIGLNPQTDNIVYWNMKRPQIPSLSEIPFSNQRNFMLHTLESALTLPQEYNCSLYDKLKEHIQRIISFLHLLPVPELRRIYDHVQQHLPNRL